MFARLSVMFGVVSFCHYRVIFLYVIAGFAFLSVIVGLDPAIQEIPGSRYACPRMI